MLATLIVCFAGVYAITSTTSDLKISLNGNDWLLTNLSSTPAISASVPGEVYLPLIKAGILDHPYYGMQPMTDQWVAKSDWIYTKTFTIDSNTELLNYRVVQLVANGIDTKANISINNQLVFTNDNMFHRNIINIKSFLKYGTNTIQVYLYNKVQWASDAHASCNTDTDGQCPSSSGNHNGFSYVNYIRTEPCSFSWDWGPAYAPVGIWKGMYIHAYNDAVIRDFMIYATPTSTTHYTPPKEDVTHTKKMNEDERLIYNAFRNKDKGLKDYTSWNTKVIVYVDTGADHVLSPVKHQRLQSETTVKGRVEVTIRSLNHIPFYLDVELPINTETNVTIDLSEISGVIPWMPNQWGQQQLYEFDVSFVNEQNESDSGMHHSFGFREIQLMQEPLPGGRSFYFRVNGVNIPIHGSNWIPSFALDNSNASVNVESLEPLFISLAESKQNMIRNWGGGIYQQKAFYDLADEYGIMIWQDFMFACAQYWTNPQWLKSVEKEVIDTVRDIQHHPSIAIWAANNENSCRKGTESETAYVDLYWKAILNNVAALDPMMRPRVSSSPSNGNETEAVPCSDVYNPFYGDVHQYLYNKDCWNTDIYVKARFVSEFGWQSWPAYSTMKQFVAESEQYYNSETMMNRQHHGGGQQQIVNEIQLHYNLPSAWNETAGYKYMLFASQYSQAYCYKVEVEFFRSLRETCSASTAGCTMGQMYWQTNDIWPGASWSGVDYLNRYKLVAYYAKHFYAKVVITGYDNGHNYTFWAVNDYVTEFRCDADNPCVVQFKANSFEKSMETNRWNVSLTSMPYESATEIYSLSHSDFEKISKCPSIETDCGLKWKLIDVKTNDVITENWMFISSPKNTTAMDPQLRITSVEVRDKKENTFSVSFSNQNIASFVSMETSVSGSFNENGIGILYPGDHQWIFKASEQTTASELQDSIDLYSLFEAGGFASK
eukprot:288679_1